MRRPFINGLSGVHWTACAQGASVDDVGVDHGRSHIGVPEQLLYRAYVSTRLQQVGCEAVAESMTAHRLGNTRGIGSQLDCPLHRSVQDVMTSDGPAARVLT